MLEISYALKINSPEFYQSKPYSYKSAKLGDSNAIIERETDAVLSYIFGFSALQGNREKNFDLVLKMSDGKKQLSCDIPIRREEYKNAIGLPLKVVEIQTVMKSMICELL